jgi:hypothetical protein
MPGGGPPTEPMLGDGGDEPAWYPMKMPTTSPTARPMMV